MASLLHQNPGGLKGPDRFLTGQLALTEVYAILWELNPLDSRRAHNENVPQHRLESAYSAESAAALLVDPLSPFVFPHAEGSRGKPVPNFTTVLFKSKFEHDNKLWEANTTHVKVFRDSLILELDLEDIRELLGQTHKSVENTVSLLEILTYLDTKYASATYETKRALRARARQPIQADESVSAYLAQQEQCFLAITVADKGTPWDEFEKLQATIEGVQQNPAARRDVARYREGLVHKDCVETHADLVKFLKDASKLHTKAIRIGSSAANAVTADVEALQLRIVQLEASAAAASSQKGTAPTKTVKHCFRHATKGCKDTKCRYLHELTGGLASYCWLHGGFMKGGHNGSDCPEMKGSKYQSGVPETQKLSKSPYLLGHQKGDIAGSLHVTK